MKYLIYFEENKTYYSSDAKNHWVTETKKAIKFTNIEAAQNTLKNHFDESLAAKLEIITADGEAADTTTLENPEETLKEFMEAADLFADYANHIDQMVSYFSKQLSHYDYMQEDILHKIEFDTVVGITAVRLVKQLKEIRIKRREVKDKLAFLQTMTTNKAVALAHNLDKFQAQQENRTYTPRVLTELFN